VSRVIAMVPTSNEAENLRLLVPLGLALDPCIEGLGNDNSPDGTGPMADEWAVGTRAFTCCIASRKVRIPLRAAPCP
jgi:hypothetical protein